jgi:hypothetical protein
VAHGRCSILAGIEATLDVGLSVLVELVNTKGPPLTRIAFVFHSAEAFMSVAILALSGRCPLAAGR